MSVVVFDIDGTIANNSHRKQYVMQRPKDWKSYKAGLRLDTPYDDIVRLLQDLYDNHVIVLCTGRSEDERLRTIEWLKDHSIIQYVHSMYMRKEKDHRDDSIVKVELLNQIRKEFNQEPWLWFDDRQRVVDALRAEGVRVLQVQPGDF